MSFKGLGPCKKHWPFWRLLSSFEAANGIIMFGWTTAIVMAVVHHVYFSEKPFIRPAKP
jgi:hypothetical protein